MTHCAGASPTATYEGFTPDRIFRSPTDLNWVIGRVLVLNDTDLATAYNFSKAYTVSPYDPAGMHTKLPAGNAVDPPSCSTKGVGAQRLSHHLQLRTGTHEPGLVHTSHIMVRHVLATCAASMQHRPHLHCLAELLKYYATSCKPPTPP